MTNEQMSKYITGECRAEHERIIAGCKCGGRPCIRFIAEDEYCYDAVGPVACPDCDPVHLIPCPTCATHRAKVKELCWHVPAQHLSECSKCGFVARDERGNKDFLHKFNPDLTTALDGHEWLVKTMMEDAGLWEGFLQYIYLQRKAPYPLNEHSGIVITVRKFKKRADILTNGLLLTQAVTAYLKGR